ncbi:MAG TPA: helix-hairpin-helix domain-containing protein, partial [Anseongella sp.]|nr:helix-hairpin-helix domain-containing protein [Anseongella sp.]
IKTAEEALQGARDIIAERISEEAAAREAIRRLFGQEALLTSKVVKSKADEAAKYRDYFDFSEPLKQCPSHRMLAIRRGEKEGFLGMDISVDADKALARLKRIFIRAQNACTPHMETAVEDSYKRLLKPSIETEFRLLHKAKADEEAISVFSDNLRQLLLAPPLGPRRILGIDPGFRTGCKVVALDEQGSLLENTTIFPHPPQNATEKTVHQLQALVKRHGIEAVAIGNGTAGKETEKLLKSIDFGRKLRIFLVNESGASIYSASEVAREEFPNLDLTVRGAVSIGRRLMDPLSELVKIDPKSIGVGQYQHDVNQTRLRESLDTVVKSCVNQVGVDLNTASKHLLTYVSGLGPKLAAQIVEYRQAKGAFPSRKDLMKVPLLGEKAFEQSAGFLRIRNAANPLDASAVHPESYPVVEKIAADLGCSVAELIARKELRKKINFRDYIGKGTGELTLKDILNELEKPGRDPREELQDFSFAEGIDSIEDLRPGMVLPGVVTNITKFGAFVDIGIKQDGLVHVSHLANRFVKDPSEVVKLQQTVLVKVLEVDHARSRVQLSMKEV